MTKPQDTPTETTAPDDDEATQPAVEPTYTETGHVWIHNPATGGTWACPADVVDFYIGRGWEHTTAPVDDESYLTDPTPSTDPVDPTHGGDSNTGD